MVPQIESGSISCHFQSPGSITGDLIIAVGYPPRPETIPLPGRPLLLGKESVWHCPDPILLLLRPQSAEIMPSGRSMQGIFGSSPASSWRDQWNLVISSPLVRQRKHTPSSAQSTLLSSTPSIGHHGCPQLLSPSTLSAVKRYKRGRADEGPKEGKV